MEACETHFAITHTWLVPNIPQKVLSEAHHHTNSVWIVITHLAHTWPPCYSNHTTSRLLLLHPMKGYQMADREKKWKTPKDLSPSWTRKMEGNSLSCRGGAPAYPRRRPFPHMDNSWTFLTHQSVTINSSPSGEVECRISSHHCSGSPCGHARLPALTTGFSPNNYRRTVSWTGCCSC